MEDPQTLTVATTWKFDMDAAGHIRKLFKATAAAGVGFCKYEPANNVFVVHNCDIIGSAYEMSNLIAKYIDNEKDNDLMEIPKVSRLGPPNAPYEVPYENDIDPEDKGALIDFAQVSESTKIPITTKYWKFSSGTTVGFEKLRYVIDEVSRLAGADIVLEESNSRIRISSYVDSSIVDDAMNRLSNLQPCLSLAITPQVSHILNVFPETKYRLKLSAYSDLNSQAACRILVDPERKDIGRLSKMFVTVMVTRSLENQDDHTPINLGKPPRPTKLRKGRSKLWADFKFQGLGDASNAPRFRDSVPEGGEAALHSQLKLNNGLPAGPLTGTAARKHPYLTREKVSFVDHWASEVEAGAVVASVPEPNSMLPSNPSAEPAQPNLRPPGIKIRKAVIVGKEGGIPAPLDTSKLSPPAEALKVDDRKKTNENVAGQRGPRLPANFNTFAYGQPKFSSAETAPRQTPCPKPFEKRESTQLIDLRDTATVSNMAIPPISYFQYPVIPAKVMKVSSATENNCTEHVKQNEHGRSPGANRGPPCGIRPRICEPESRVFRRTMGQKAGNNANDRKIKENQDNRTEDPRAPFMASNTSTPLFSCPSSKSIELSEWKKAQLADEDVKRAVTLNDFLRHIRRVLDGARCFPGTVSFEIQLGLILANRSLIEKYTNVIFDTKVWNTIFQPKNNLPTPSTIFTNMLTTSGADVDFILDLPDTQAAFACRMFSEEILSRHVWYEFQFTTKNDEILVVTVDESGTAVVNRPESVLGAVNIHCAAQTWDMRGVVKGTVEYIQGDEEIDQAIQNLIGKLYIEPNLTNIVIFARIPEDGQLDISKVLMKRSTRHRFHTHETGSLPEKLAKKPAVHDSISVFSNYRGVESESVGSSSSQATSMCIQDPILQITEVQNLLLAYYGDDKTVVRARAMSAEEMVDDHRLWYEMSIIHPKIEDILRSNKHLEFGDNSVSWTAFKPPGGNEQQLTAKTPETRPAELNARRCDNRTPPPCPMAEISSKDVSDTFHGANKIVQKIDAVGWANVGPEAHAGLKVDHAASMAARSMGTAERPSTFW
ncbi:hypothetical protein AJ78_02815 [Emergomyces pasteurianus Ep9510]|uniref:Uncharacterized protein n=1 Tax=Emergomyces pasteurianus Ep9510 TaxID=1447872 RepID=A0A1J9Q9Z7_9EURO|nr:hypothetical protein AJ78_02815 [Emergomyces pasteurianus Ep9510]